VHDGKADYYVYVYIDPRNLEEFYFGKGRGSRKEAHLFENSDSEKSRRIAAIRAAGLEPIIRVIARRLTQHDALLVEKTLLWKLGRNLTNISSGHYATNFRPQDTLHQRLSGFEFQNALWYFNVGESHHRRWEDCSKYGFVSAGHGLRWRDAIRGLEVGDLIAAYLKQCGYVGVGRVVEPARPIREVSIDGRPLLSLPLVATHMHENADSNELCEYVARVTWLAMVDRSRAHWIPKSGLYSTTLVRASLENQPATIRFLEERFGVDLQNQRQ
jgi:hypothetical protein